MLNAFARRVSAYAQLSARDVQILTAASERSHYVEGACELIRQGDAPNSLFILMEGWACRYRVLPNSSRQITAFLMPGDVFDIQIGQHRAADHSIGTLTGCQLVRLSRQEGEKLVFASRSLSQAFWNMQLAEADIAREWLVSLGRRSAVSRFAHLLLELCARIEVMGDTEGNNIELSLTQDVLSDALGITMVHLNRIIKQIREDGIADFRRRKLIVHDKDRLVRLAEFSDSYLYRRMGIDDSALRAEL